jgi:hypothetical protein
MNSMISVPDRTVIDTLISAIEGGIYYWCSAAMLSAPDPLRARFQEADGGAVFEFATADWPRIVALMATKEPRHYANMVCERGDAETGDVLVQLACFGELKYG